MSRFARTLRCSIALVPLSVLSGCEKLHDICLHHGKHCEGEVLVECFGGWMSASLFVQRTDCAATGGHCARLNSGFTWSTCVPDLGECEPSSFVEVCESIPADMNKRATQCVNGRILPSGEACEFAPDGGRL